MNQLSLGVMAQSKKPDERRLALHPSHLAQLTDDLRGRIFLESGYGTGFGYRDEDLAGYVGGFRSHQQLIDECDVILQPKPLLSDISELREGQVLWGWPHCVQDEQLTQVAIDRRLTLIAFEAMHHWNSDRSFGVHVFHKNNELAGYCSVLHALQLTGSSPNYGPRRTAAVIGFGSTARGAITALNALGVHAVDALTHREPTAVSAPIPGVRLVQWNSPDSPDQPGHALTGAGIVPLPEFLAEHDIIVNCTLQDTDAPEMFLTDSDLAAIAPGSLIVDVSCDAGMGFSWARPTSFRDPTFVIGRNVTYYAVDHSPSYLWNSATWEISRALLPFVRTVLDGPDAWDADPTISRAIEVRDGVIQNPAILTFQARDPQHPHYPLAS